MVATAREAFHGGDAETAVGLLAQATTLFRGEPYEGVAEEALPAGEIARLHELRATLVEDTAEAELACGRGHQRVGELEAFVQANPYRERAWGLLMRALYQCGRPADALDAYGRARVLLAAELGSNQAPHYATSSRRSSPMTDGCCRPLGRRTTRLRRARTLPQRTWGTSSHFRRDSSRSCSPSSRIRPGCCNGWDLSTDGCSNAIERSCERRWRKPAVSRSTTLGDVLLVAFPTPATAIAAAAAGQRALREERWPEDTSIRVRMGIASGEAMPAGGEYAAEAVNRAARVCDGAHGGQVLVSEESALLAGSTLPPRCGLVGTWPLPLEGFRTACTPVRVAWRWHRIVIPGVAGSPGGSPQPAGADERVHRTGRDDANCRQVVERNPPRDSDRAWRSGEDANCARGGRRPGRSA